MYSRFDILYGNLMALLKALLNEEDFYEYYQQLPENTQKQFALLTSRVQQIFSNNEVRKNKKDLPELDFISVLQQYREEFSDYLPQQVKKLWAIGVILEKLYAEIKINEKNYDFQEIIDVNMFKIIVPDAEITVLDAPGNSHLYFNKKLKDAVFLICTKEIDQLKEAIEKLVSVQELDILYHLLGKLTVDMKFDHDQYILISADTVASLATIKAFLKLHMVASGKQIHIPHGYKNKPVLPPGLKWNMDDEYQQFNEVISILSEYNSHKDDVLDKFMRMYHVLENFMTRYPVSELMKRRKGAVISLRILEKIALDRREKENIILEKFFRKKFDISYDGNDSFKKHVEKKWKNFAAARANYMADWFSFIENDLFLNPAYTKMMK